MRHGVQGAAVALALAVAALPARAQQGWVRPGGLGEKAGKLRQTANAVEFVDGKRVWVAGKAGFLASSADGATWTEINPTVDAELNDVYFRDELPHTDTGKLLRRELTVDLAPCPVRETRP